MPRSETFIIIQAANLQRSSRRSIAFLESPEDRTLNARRVYEGLDTKRQQMVRNRFDYWLQFGKRDEYFHGWSEPERNRGCFVFKWKYKNQHQRLYGFLNNPRPNTNPSFQVCVLTSHAQKNTKETDPAEMNGVNALRHRSEVIEAIKRVYPEEDLH